MNWLFFLSILISFGTTAQNDSIIWNYSEHEDRFGIVEIAHDNGDTSVIVGFVEHSNDTLFFVDLKDSIVADLAGGHGCFLDYKMKGVVLRDAFSYLENHEGLYARFQYFGNKYEPVLIGSFDFVVNDSIYLPAVPNVKDTVYSVECSRKGQHWARVENERMKSSGLNVAFSPQLMHYRKRKKKEIPYRPNSYELVFDVYYSINPRKIDVRKLVGNEITLGKRSYTVIYRKR